jgi:hypothetical protein
MRAREETFNDSVVGVRGFVFDERLNLLGRGGQADQVEGQTSDQSAAVGLRRRLEPDLRKPSAHQEVHT